MALLERYRINMVADVRSVPYSLHCPQFNRDNLVSILQAARIGYVFLGKELGGRVEEPSCYRNGRVSFEQVVKGEAFSKGINVLLERLAKNRMALMCAEKDPLACHRTILIGHELKKQGVDIKHILADGEIEDNNDAERRLLRELGLERTLFEPVASENDLIEQAYGIREQTITSLAKEQSNEYE
jgi:uncharacterized protein (DUF488 family)